MFKEFKAFAMRGNVVDLAIGVIIGAAFGKIITSFVNDVLMPPLSLLTGKTDMASKFIDLSGTPHATIAEAKDRGLDVAKEFLRAWTFATSMSFRISALKRIVDWSPGLRERKCIQFSYHTGFDRPYAALDAATLNSAVRLLNSDLSPTLRRAVRWHANGVTSEYADDQFYYFWLAIELLAIETKAPEPVHDACPKCRGPLFCNSCGIAPTHKPYILT